MKLFKGLERLRKIRQKSRDKIAHWTWGQLPEKDDCLILIDPRKMVLFEKNNDKIFVYRENDFVNIIQDNVKLGTHYHLFHQMIYANFDFYDQIVSDPEVAKYID